MDFSRLTDSQLRDFLSLNNTIFQYVQPPRDYLVNEATSVFNRIKDLPDAGFTEPVVDLYLAQLFLDQGGLVEERYGENYLRTMDAQTKAAFGQIFTLDPEDPSFIERLIRVLGFLDALEEIPVLGASSESSTGPGPSSIQGLPRPLWSGYGFPPTIPSGTYPIPISYPVSRGYDLVQIQAWRDLIGRESGANPDFTNFDLVHLRRLYQLYNEYFFNSALPQQINLEISNRLTRVAGKCGPCSGTGCECRYTIRLSRPIFAQLNLTGGQRTQSGGLECRTQLECVQLVLEHEMIHLAIRIVHPRRKHLDRTIYSSHGQLFKGLVEAYFGQTRSTHSIGSMIAADEQGEPITKEQAYIGQIVSYQDKQDIIKGVIVDINPVNAVLRILDGDRGVLVRYAFLRTVPEEDDDYEDLEEFSDKIKAKYRYYGTLRKDQTVQIKAKLKGQTSAQVYTGRIVELKPRSDKVTVQIPPGAYVFRYADLVLPSSSTSTSSSSTTRPVSTSSGSVQPVISTIPSSTLPLSSRSLSRAEISVGTPVLFENNRVTIRGIVVKTNPVNAVVYSVNNEPWNIKYDELRSTTNDQDIQQLRQRLEQKKALVRRLKVGDNINVYYRQRGNTYTIPARVTQPFKNDKIGVSMNGRDYRIEYLDLVV